MRRKNLNAAVIETLQSRRLLAVAVSGAQMFVTGTAGDDHVLISLDVADPSKLDVNLNGQVQQFDRTSITSIDVEAGAGPDQIVVDESAGGITIPMTLSGGGGNDSNT